MTRYMKRGGEEYGLKSSLTNHILQKAIGVRMGSVRAPGLGSQLNVAKIMFEVAGVSEEIAREHYV